MLRLREALLHGSIVGRELAGLGEAGPSDHKRRLFERRGKGESGVCLHPEPAARPR